MTTLSKLAQVLNGLVQNQDLTSSDLVTNSVWVGGTTSSPSVQVTTTLLNSFLTSITAGSGISVTGSAPSQTVAVDSTVVRTNGANAFTANQSLGGHKLTNVADPTSAQDAATKNYVDMASSTPLDGTFRIENTTDPTKEIAFDASGISTGTTRTITMPDADVDLGKVGTAIQKDGSVTYTANQPMGSHKLTGLSAGTTAGDSVRYEQVILTSGANDFAADQSMGSHKLTNVTDPSSAQDAATKNYVDTTAVLLSSGNVAGGYPVLDSGGKVSYAQLPSALMTFKGAWDASTNTPTLADGTGTNGDTYRASVAGTQNLGSGSQTWAVGDFAIYNGTIWQHSPAADGVSSVNGSTGAVTVNAINQLTGDVTAGPASGSQSKAATVAAIAGTTVSGTTGTGNVMFSASPTTTGTLTAAAVNASGSISASNFSGSSSGTNTGDQTITLTGDAIGSGTGSFAVTVNNAPKLQTTQTAGTSFSTTTSYVVRWALNGETAGRIYIADAASAASNGKYLGFGVMNHTGAVVAGNSVTVVTEGLYTLAASDSAFSAGDIGKAVYLLDDGSGSFSTTPPSTSGSAAYRIGMVVTTTSMWLGTWQLNGIA